MKELLLLKDCNREISESHYNEVKNILEYFLYIDMSLVDISGKVNKSKKRYVKDVSWETVYLDELFDAVSKKCTRFLPAANPFGSETRDMTKLHKESLLSHCLISCLYMTKFFYIELLEKKDVKVYQLYHTYKNKGFFSLQEIQNDIDRKVEDGKTKKEELLNREIKKSTAEIVKRMEPNSFYNLFRQGKLKEKDAKEYISRKIVTEPLSVFNHDTYYELIMNGLDFDRSVDSIMSGSVQRKKNSLSKRLDMMMENVIMDREKKNSQGDKIDDILFDYVVERYYNHNLIVELAECIADCEKNKHDQVQEFFAREDFIDVLMHAIYLPNTGSRICSVKMALEALETDGIDRGAYYVENKEITPYEKFINTKGAPVEERVQVFVNNFKQYCIRTSYLSYPVFENVFFILFFENALKEKGNKKAALEEMMRIICKCLLQANDNPVEKYLNEQRVRSGKTDSEKSKRIQDLETLLYKKMIEIYQGKSFMEIYGRRFSKRYFEMQPEFSTQESKYVMKDFKGEIEKSSYDRATELIMRRTKLKF